MISDADSLSNTLYLFNKKGITQRKNVMNKVLMTIKNLEERQGASARQIIDFLIQRIPNHTKYEISTLVKEALRDGLTRGMLSNQNGLFSINPLEKINQIKRLPYSELRGRRGKRQGRSRRKVGRNRHHRILVGNRSKKSNKPSMRLQEAIERVLKHTRKGGKRSGRKRSKGKRQRSGKRRHTGQPTKKNTNSSSDETNPTDYEDDDDTDQQNQQGKNKKQEKDKKASKTYLTDYEDDEGTGQQKPQKSHKKQQKDNKTSEDQTQQDDKLANEKTTSESQL